MFGYMPEYKFINQTSENATKGFKTWPPTVDWWTLTWTTYLNKSIRVLNVGSMMNRRKPSWLWDTSTVFLSQRFEHGRPSSFSISPWRKNSSESAYVHLNHVYKGGAAEQARVLKYLSCNDQSLAAWDISATWTISAITFTLSSSLGLFNASFIWLICWKCWLMSVASTISTTSVLNS